MSALTDLSAETALQQALMDLITADSTLTSVLGNPPRVFDVNASQPAVPFLEIARHETRDRSAALVEAQEHVLDLRVLTRWSGRGEARALLQELRRVIDLAVWPENVWRVVYCNTVFSDVLALSDGRTYRGLLRLRALTERL